MSKYTAELRALIAHEIPIFDFEYTRSADAQAILSNEDLQQHFIDHYALREIGLETVERWKHRLMTQWRESIGNFDKLIIAYNNDINIMSNGATKSLQRFNNTPKSALDFGEQSQHATTITENDNKGYSGLTEIELLEKYHDKIKDIESEFLESFDNLFMQIF